MNSQTRFQTRFFDKIAMLFPDQMIVNEVMELLNLRRGAAYKRMNGETALTAEELIRIAGHFDISLDNFFFGGKLISFSHPFMKDERVESRDFLSLIQGYMETLNLEETGELTYFCLLYTSPSPRDQRGSRMPSSA